MEDNFIKQMLEIGVLSYKEQETLFSIAQRDAQKFLESRWQGQALLWE